jgi:hypothetical protein
MKNDIFYSMPESFLFAEQKKLYLCKKNMGRINQGYQGCCTKCGTLSSSVFQYGVRQLKHFTIGSDSLKEVPFIVFRCYNQDCEVKTFRHYDESVRSEINGRSTYSKSSKNYVINKMSNHAVAYNSFQNQIVEDFKLKTSLSTLYTWFSSVKTTSKPESFKDISILNTDEKHPYKKKHCE